MENTFEEDYPELCKSHQELRREVVYFININGDIIDERYLINYNELREFGNLFDNYEDAKKARDEIHKLFIKYKEG